MRPTYHQTAWKDAQYIYTGESVGHLRQGMRVYVDPRDDKPYTGEPGLINCLLVTVVGPFINSRPRVGALGYWVEQPDLKPINHQPKGQSMPEQTKHSPAPWKAEEWKIGQGQEPRTEMVLHNNVHQIGRLVWSDAADKPWDINKSEQEANARLIAAAPDLLQALRRLVHPMADDTDVQNAFAAIYQATGENE